MGLTRSSAQSHALGQDGMTWHDMAWLQDSGRFSSVFRKRNNMTGMWHDLFQFQDDGRGWWDRAEEGWQVGPSKSNIKWGIFHWSPSDPMSKLGRKKALPGWSHLWATDQRWLLTSVARCDSVKEVFDSNTNSNFQATHWGSRLVAMAKGAPNCLGDLVTQYGNSYNSYSCKTQVRPGRRAAYLGLQLISPTL